MIAFIQPFGLQAPGGGSRILRALLSGEHPDVLSINTGLSDAPLCSTNLEIHLPIRPAFGRLERTRLHGALGVFDEYFRPRLEAQLKRVIQERQIKAVHVIAHSFDIVSVTRVTSELGIPCFLSVHDDLIYTAIGHPLMQKMIKALGRAWRSARGIFAISDEIGQEYSRRYGSRTFQIITDGLDSPSEAPRKAPEKKMRVYFMGLFHNTYGPNLRSLLDALKTFRKEHQDWEISVTCRSGSISCTTTTDDVPVKVLPFAPEETVAQDLISADLLYLPLPFQTYAASFGKFSMSTKLVTYLGSGLPIVYHGPADAAARTLLARHSAAVICMSLDPAAIARELLEATSNREKIVNNALVLARSQFMLRDQQSRFWSTISAVL